MDPNYVNFVLVSLLFAGVSGFSIGAWILPVVGMRRDFGTKDEPWIDAVKDVLGFLVPVGVIPAFLILLGTVLQITTWHALILVVCFGLTQYVGTLVYIWEKGFCRLCHQREPGARYGICKECLKGAAYDRGLKLVQDNERW